MAYDKSKIEKQAIEAITKNRLFFMEDVYPYLACSRSTFYNLGLDKLDSIKDALAKERTKVKVGIRAKLYNDTSATGLIALYKLVGTQEEADRLNGRATNINVGSENKDAEINIVISGSKSNLLDE
jgi:hypothetical protein